MANSGIGYRGWYYTPLVAGSTTTPLTLTSTVTPAGVLTKQTSKTLTGAVTPAGVLSRVASVVRSLTGAVTAAGVLTKQVAQTKASSVTPAGVLTSAARQVVAPDTTVAADSWTTDLGSAVLAPAIDELVADDADYIQSPTAPTGTDIAKLGLATFGGTPGAGTVTVFLRVRS